MLTVHVSKSHIHVNASLYAQRERYIEREAALSELACPLPLGSQSTGRPRAAFAFVLLQAVSAFFFLH